MLKANVYKRREFKLNLANFGEANFGYDFK